MNGYVNNAQSLLQCIPTFYSDTWTFDPVGGTWNQITPGDSGVFGASASAVVAYDSLSDRFIVQGGMNVQPSTGYGCVYVGTMQTSIWTLDAAHPTAWKRLLYAPGSERINHTLIIDSAHRRMIRFAGWLGQTVVGGNPPYNDVWALNLDGSPQWTQMFPSGPEPPARFAHCAIYDPFGDRMIIHGGIHPGALADTWQLTLAGQPTWSQIASNGPSGYCQAVLDAPNRRMIVVAHNSTWQFNLTTNQWSSLNANPGTPVPSLSGSEPLGFDSNSQRLFVFPNWVFDLRLNPSTDVDDPPGRMEFALATPSPQPANNSMLFRCTLPTTETARLELFDVNGRRVVARTVAGPGAKQLTVDTSRLEPGTYFVQLTQGARVARSRAVILR